MNAVETFFVESIIFGLDELIIIVVTRKRTVKKSL